MFKPIFWPGAILASHIFILSFSGTYTLHDPYRHNSVRYRDNIPVDASDERPSASTPFLMRLEKDSSFIRHTSGSLRESHVYPSFKGSHETRNDWLEGLSSLDLIMIQKYLEGKDFTGYPLATIAADVNGDDCISNQDVIALKDLLLGRIDQVENTQPWRFVKAGDHLISSSVAGIIDHSISTFENLIPVKVGDVNGSVSDYYSALKESIPVLSELELQIDDKVFNEGEIVEIPIYTKSELHLEALQASFIYDGSLMEYIGVNSGSTPLNDADISTETADDAVHLNMIKTDVHSWLVNQKEAMFSLRFKTKAQGKISTCLALDKERISALGYNKDDEKYHLNLNFVEERQVMTVSQNSPNPFTDESKIEISLTSDSPVEVRIYDNSGVIIYSSYHHYPAGVHDLIIGSDFLKDQYGIFFIHIETGEAKEIKKILRLN